MSVSFSIARRYLFSKGNRNVINIITGIAAVGVGIGSLAMIVILSVFNGLEGLVSDLYTSIDPDIRVSPAVGKTLDPDSLNLEEIRKWPEVEIVTPLLEETVFLQNEEHQSIVTIRGIQPEYLSKLGLDSFVVDGELYLKYGNYNYAIMGYGVADNLNLFSNLDYEPVNIYAAKRDGVKSINPENKFNTERIIPTAIVALNPEFDYKYLYTTDSFAAKLLDYEGLASCIDFSLKPGIDHEVFREKLKERLGNKYVVKTRIEQNEVMYKTYRTEKWVTFFILVFIMIVAMFNLIGSLAMLIIEKKGDISLLTALGYTRSSIRKLFLIEGMLISGYGGFIGVAVGTIIVLAQQYIGIIPLEGGLVEFYPVILKFSDLSIVIGITLLIGYAASLIPVRVLLRNLKYHTNASA